MESRKGQKYENGELEVILSLVPTEDNIKWLSKLLRRSEEAIEIVYKIAYEYGPFGENADIQVEKIISAKQRIGISIGRKK